MAGKITSALIERQRNDSYDQIEECTYLETSIKASYGMQNEKSEYKTKNRFKDPSPIKTAIKHSYRTQKYCVNQESYLKLRQQKKFLLFGNMIDTIIFDFSGHFSSQKSANFQIPSYRNFVCQVINKIQTIIRPSNLEFRSLSQKEH